MLELTEDNVYKVRNFAKHQNVKVKEKEISKNIEAEVKNSNAAINEDLKVEIVHVKNKLEDDKTVENRVESSEKTKGENIEVNNKAMVIADDSIGSNRSGDKLQKK
jgi:hypothetical protein